MKNQYFVYIYYTEFLSKYNAVFAKKKKKKKKISILILYEN